MFKKITIGTLLILSFLFGTAHCEIDAQANRYFPRPIAELEQVTQKWLDQFCLGVSERELEMGILQFTCKRGDQNLHIRLTPRSALATEITVRDDINDSRALELEKRLSAHIDRYLNPTVEGAGIPIYGANIPAAVLSKMDAAVCIQSENDNSSIQFSGFFIDREGTIICTTHDLKQFGTLAITDSKGRVHTGEVVEFNEKIDLALIHTTIKPSAHVSLINGRRTLIKGAAIYSIGCPANHANTVTAGTISEPPVRANALVYWQVNMKILPGSSGSPVFDRHGTLVGMIKGRNRKNNTVGFLIPTDRIKHFIDGF